LDVVAARFGPLDSDPAFGVGVENDRVFGVAVTVALADNRDLRISSGLAVGEDAEAGGLVNVYVVGVGALKAELDAVAFGFEHGVAGLAECDEGHESAASALAKRELWFAGHVLCFEFFECAAPACHLAVFVAVAAREGGRSGGLRHSLSAALARLTATLLASALPSSSGGLCGCAASLATLDGLGLAAGAAALLRAGGGGDLLNAVGAGIDKFEFEAAAEAAIERVDEFARLAVGPGDADLLNTNGSAIGVEEEVGAGGFEADPAGGFAEDGLARNNPRASGLGGLHEPERCEERDKGGSDRCGAFRGVARSHDKRGGGSGGCRVSEWRVIANARGRAVRAV